MLQNIEITGVNMEVHEKLYKYIMRRIGRVDRYLPRNERELASATVHIKDNSALGKNDCYCLVTLYLPGEKFRVKESTLNLYAAIDIVQAELKNQILAYCARHKDGRTRRRGWKRRP